MRIDQQHHGYLKGHQLLASSIRLDKRDQELIDRLSDMSGPLGPGEAFAPYLTGYPLPSQHYVLARTWLDEDARRAGCVLTHSLILDASDWAVMASPATLLPLFTMFSKDGSRTLAPLSVEASTAAKLPTIPASRLTPLVEALFLEQRQPVVWFDAEDGEVATLRVIEAVWPALRRQFAFCTYALQPRGLEDRWFDLLLAPKSARSRYAHWDGRRLELGRDRPSTAPRHPWSAELASSIFATAKPRLAVDDGLGVLAGDESGSPNLLRLSMLWRDLSEKARGDPAATLGLLDILATTNLPEAVKAERAEQFFSDTLLRLPSEAPGEQGWHLLELLLGKLPGRRPSGQTLQAISSVADKLAGKSPHSALSTIDGLPEQLPTSRAVIKGVARNFAASGLRDGAATALLSASGAVIVRLLLYGPEFRRAAMASAAAPREWWSLLARTLSLAEPRPMRVLRRQLVPLITGPEHTELIEPLLIGADLPALKRSLRALRSGNNVLAEQAVTDAVLTALLPTQAHLLREAVISLEDESVELDQLITATLQPTVSDLRWLVDEARFGEKRRIRLLVAFLRKLSDSQLAGFARSIPSDLALAAQHLRTAADQEAAEELARLLPLVSMPATETLEVAKRVLPAIPTQQGIALLCEIVPRLVAELPLHDFSNFKHLLDDDRAARAIQRVGSSRLIRTFFPSGQNAFDDSRQSIITSTILTLSPAHPLREGALRSVDEVAAAFAGRPGREPDPHLVAAWAELFTTAVALRSPGTAGAAAITLNYALARPSAAVSPLILVAFPIVHHFAEQPRTLFDYVLSPFGFDRARDVRERLVEQFQRSSWPPSDLLISAWMIGAEEGVLRILTGSRHGREYMDAIRRDLRHRGDLDPASRAQLERIIRVEPPRKRRKR